MKFVLCDVPEVLPPLEPVPAVLLCTVSLLDIDISDRGTARLASTFLESMVCGSLAKVLSTPLISMKVINPKPRDRLDTGSFMKTVDGSGESV